MGVPLGIPPGPDDPVISQVAPEDCVFYTTWAATAAPNSRSKNQAEQMLAEPEVRIFVEHIEKWVRHAVTQSAGDRDANSLSDATFDTLLMMLRHQTALFVSEVKVKGKRPNPLRLGAKGGLVVALGTDAIIARRLFYENVHAFFINLNAESIETVTFYGAKWYRVKATSDFPSLLVGIYSTGTAPKETADTGETIAPLSSAGNKNDSYLIVAVGEESPDPIVKRMDRPIPKWLAESRRLAGFQRPTGLTYINLRRLREASAAGSDAHRLKLLEALGLSQLPWVMSASGFVGPDVVTRTVLPIEGQPRGLLSAAAGRGLQREDLAAIPRDATMALAARFDLQKTWDIVQSAAKADAEVKEPAVKTSGPVKSVEGPGQPATIPPSLPPDVFNSLGDRWCFYNSPKEGGMILTGLTGVVPITDRQQFSRHYEVLKRFVTQNLPPDDGANGGGSRVRRFPFAGGDVHYAGMGEIGLAPAWFAGEKQLVFALTPQGVKACLSRPAGGGSLADVPEIAAELSNREPLLAIGYLDAPRVFETAYPLLMLAAPSYLGANGMVEGRRDMSVFPSLPSVCRHLRPGVSALRRTDLGLELTSRGSMPGFGLAGPVMFLAWDSEWLNLVFGAPEDSVPPMPVPVAVPALQAAPPPPAGGVAPPPAVVPRR
jgi:hypothetical protein